MTIRDLLQDLCGALSAGAFIYTLTVWASHLAHVPSLPV